MAYSLYLNESVRYAGAVLSAGSDYLRSALDLISQPAVDAATKAAEGRRAIRGSRCRQARQKGRRPQGRRRSPRARVTGSAMPGLRVVVEEAGPEGSQAALAALLERTNFWDVLEARVAELAAAPETFRILIKPDAAGFDPSSPVITAPSLVEALIDLLFDRGYKNVGVATATDASGIWLENRSPEIVADLLGLPIRNPARRAL